MHGTDVAYSYGALFSASQRVAGWLLKEKIVAGDRVGIFMSNDVSYLCALYGVLIAGAIAVPVNAKLHAREIAYIFQHSGATTVITSQESKDTVKEANRYGYQGSIAITIEQVLEQYSEDAPKPTIHQCAGVDPAWLFYTSGTTGKPKGATLSHRNLLLMTTSFLQEVLPDFSKEDSLIHAAPMSHGSGMYNFAAIQRQATQVIPKRKSFNAIEFLNLSASCSNAVAFLAPTMIQRILREDITPAHIASIKTLVYGGGPMPLATIRKAITIFGKRFSQIYGQGECPMTITKMTPEEHEDFDTGGRNRLTSVGRKFDSVNLRIQSDDSNGGTGEIEVKSEIVMLGYWDPDKPGQLSRDSEWLPTGDMGFIDEAGYLYLSDRSKDVIISGGSNIYSREVEDALSLHPNVEEVAVVGRKSEEWGEEVVAFIVLKHSPDQTRDDLNSFCEQHIASYKRPKDYLFIESLPKNAYGKIEKNKLRSMLKAN